MPPTGVITDEACIEIASGRTPGSASGEAKPGRAPAQRLRRGTRTVRADPPGRTPGGASGEAQPGRAPA
ncbi:hypothetical protein [Bowmanella dokdonensis]|uniref:Uncharacterized protein n=1 Tax=Bowmanella dokdonensis TaxID=751969 RepID=A0A939IS50_9ALTE|nr:hypothetical protein [Bowmanella dokdonensis]MBN7826066.1 hypothetical protein [Bowmanella dokdonensis]